VLTAIVAVCSFFLSGLLGEQKMERERMEKRKKKLEKEKAEADKGNPAASDKVIPHPHSLSSSNTCVDYI
jgi:hypothetical protein